MSSDTSNKKAAAVMMAVVVAAFTIASGRYAEANSVPEYSLEKKTRLSNLVFLGHVESVRSEEPTGRQFAHIRVDTMLKGTPRDSVDVLFRGMVAEFDPPCCEVGKGYLFLVVGAKDGTFQSVNGPFGVYPLPRPSAPPKTQ